MAAAIAGLFCRVIGDRPSQIVTTAALLISAALSVFAFSTVALGGGATQIIPVLPWIHSGAFAVDWTIRVDTITAVMLVVVTSVSSLVHLYSIGYMHEDPARQRFFAYLSLFTFAMLMLVTADNLVQMFFGWEGVGLASYLLIGFWYEKPSANAAAMGGSSHPTGAASPPTAPWRMRKATRAPGREAVWQARIWRRKPGSD